MGVWHHIVVWYLVLGFTLSSYLMLKSPPTKTNSRELIDWPNVAPCFLIAMFFWPAVVALFLLDNHLRQ
jgi:hypothetical protein